MPWNDVPSSETSNSAKWFQWSTTALMQNTLCLVPSVPKYVHTHTAHTMHTQECTHTCDGIRAQTCATWHTTGASFGLCEICERRCHVRRSTGGGTWGYPELQQFSFDLASLSLQPATSRNLQALSQLGDRLGPANLSKV